jgi:hypothetical protein
MLFTIYYLATYRNVKADETLAYTFPITQETCEACDLLAESYAMWILEELPQSGFILDNLERVYKNE